MSKIIFSCILLCFAPSVTVLGQDKLPGMWRLAHYNNQSQTTIAQLQNPATYEVCRKLRPDLSTLPGKVRPVVDGSVYTDLALEANSCVILRGKRIGLSADIAAVNFFHYEGTYKRIDPNVTWSPLLDWLYRANRQVPTRYFPVSIGARGLYRVCQGVNVIDNNPPNPYEVGYSLSVDGVPVSLDDSGSYVIRLSRGMCVDVFGANITAEIMTSEISTTVPYTGIGKISYALEQQLK